QSTLTNEGGPMRIPRTQRTRMSVAYADVMSTGVRILFTWGRWKSSVTVTMTMRKGENASSISIDLTLVISDLDMTCCSFSLVFNNYFNRYLFVLKFYGRRHLFR